MVQYVVVLPVPEEENGSIWCVLCVEWLDDMFTTCNFLRKVSIFVLWAYLIVDVELL